jgi:PleD family two-component response regulator
VRQHRNHRQRAQPGTEVAILLLRTGAAPNRERGASGTSAEALCGQGETVLPVEDDAPIRASLAAMLAELCYRVFKAEDAAVGLAVLGQAAVSVILTDLTMPGSMDGLEFAEVARGVARDQGREARPESRPRLHVFSGCA